MRPRHVLTGPQNLMFEVDAAEEAKHVAVYRYELTGELYDDDEILDFFYNDITELEQEQRDETTFKSWLEEMIGWGRFCEEENEDAQGPTSAATLLSETYDASRDATAKLRLGGTPTPRSRVARMTKRPTPNGVGRSASQ